MLLFNLMLDMFIGAFLYFEAAFMEHIRIKLHQLLISEL